MRRPLAALALGCLLAACGVGTDTAGTQPTPGLQGEIVASEVVVGDQRLPLGILEQNTPVSHRSESDVYNVASTIWAPAPT